MGFLPGKSRLQILLDDKRMTQQELADRIGASKQQVNNWINGKLKMNLGNAKTVAMALGVQMDELYEWEFSPRPKEKKSGR